MLSPTTCQHLTILLAKYLICQFVKDEVDIVIQVVVDALGLNVFIYQDNRGLIEVLKICGGALCKDIYVVSCGTPGTLGGPYCINHINYSCFGVILRRHALDMPRLKHVILFVNVTSFNNTVTSYVMSQCHMCIGHMTIYYKRATNTLVGGVSVSSLVC